MRPARSSAHWFATVDDDAVCLVIDDDGSGIDAADRDRVCRSVELGTVPPGGLRVSVT